ncbi:hypothetical protein AOQ84DRAFT_356161 [Glonium stellatum]|uniref:Uncharacterized protein n=1 Tax=Glonium stellatum TaxID=574774 RepID=A0A8E2JPU5_9PEZI|nr:hypothetical protein AOQ84DRAFT_356161 [Glonium stellatum]
MGRQAYLTRLALGRSAFETPEQVTPEASRTDAATFEFEPISSSYEQVYDERGHPINPGSREHGRALREAQNDVLAAIGVVERRLSTSSEDLPSRKRRIEKLERLETEDSVGNTIAFVSALSENICTWWVGCLRDRILVLHTPANASFAQILSSQYQSSSFWAFFFAGFPAQFLSTIAVQASIYAGLVLRPLDHILLWAQSPRRTRRFFQRWKPWINQCFRLFVEIAFYPLFYHAGLQRLHLIPPRPYLPPLGSFIPFTPLSPIQGIPLPISFSGEAILACSRSFLHSPLVLLCLEQYMERWVYSTVYEAIESSTIQPSNPDLVSPDDSLKRRAAMILGLRRKTPAAIRNAINRLLAFVQWGYPFQPAGHIVHSTRLDTRSNRQSIREQRGIEVAGQQLTNLSPLDIPLAHAEAFVQQDIHGMAEIGTATILNEPSGPLSPISHTASEASQNVMDPTVRITSRDAAEGIVELEVRLPHITSPPAEAPISNTTAPDPDEDPFADYTDERQQWVFHRVTHLSMEPGQMLGAILKSQMVTWATLPLRIVGLRMMASHFLATHPQVSLDLGRMLIKSSPFGLWPACTSQIGLRSAGVLAGRVALCGAIEMAVDLSLWGCQWVCVTWIGKRYFNWGKL